MARNRAHNDTKMIILQALNGPPIFAAFLLNFVIDKFFNNELSLTSKNKQTGLLFLGIHASALTISEALWGVGGATGYKMFLEAFMDCPEARFSIVAKEIHNWRNILAHQFISRSGHNIDYDYNLREGFVKRKGDLIINPEIYLNSYLDIFLKNKILEFFKNLDKTKQQEIKKRIVEKYLKN